MTKRQVSRDHHWVPRFLLRAWEVKDANGQELLHGYWWNDHKQELRCSRKGVGGFCYETDLLSLKEHEMGTDAIETVFFGDIDTQGAIVREKLLSKGPQSLSGEERSAFSRVLRSLLARHPTSVQRLRDGGKYMADGLDNDPVILAAMAEHGLTMRPSELAEQRYSLEDKALTIIQPVVDNPETGQRLNDAHWAVRELGRWDGTLVLSDRPLVQKGDFQNGKILWYLPLSPAHAFLLADGREPIDKALRLTGERFAKICNAEVARQADQYVFATDPAHQFWIARVLRKRR